MVKSIEANRKTYRENQHFHSTNEDKCMQCGRSIEVNKEYHIIVYEYNANMLFNMLLFCDFSCLKRWLIEQSG